MNATEKFFCSGYESEHQTRTIGFAVVRSSDCCFDIRWTLLLEELLCCLWVHRMSGLGSVFELHVSLDLKTLAQESAVVVALQ